MRWPSGVRCLLTVLGLMLLIASTPSADTVRTRPVTSIGRRDIEGGGMIDVRGDLAAIGHMEPPHATSILDVSEPARPRVLARIPVKPGTHSHKARRGAQAGRSRCRGAGIGPIIPTGWGTGSMFPSGWAASRSWTLPTSPSPAP